MSFSYQIKKNKKYTHIGLKGMLLSMLEGNQLLAALPYSDKPSAKLLLDMSDLKYINSEGFNALLKLLTFARNHDGEIVLMSLSEEIQQLFIISKLNSIFTIAKDKKEAEKILADS